MILQRLSTALRKQDWFTVAVETLIVVFGVFIGLQVNNWNAANTERATERELLAQIQHDVAAAVKLKTDWLAEMTAHRQSLIEAVDVVQNRPDRATVSDAGCRAMWSSHLLFYPVAPLGSLDTLLARQRLYTSQGQALHAPLLAYRDHHEVIEQLNISLTGLANLGDAYGDAFPRHIVAKPAVRSPEDQSGREQVDRVTDAMFQTACRLDVIRADQTIQNRILSNLARTDGVLQRTEIEISSLEQIKAVLMESQP